MSSRRYLIIYKPGASKNSRAPLGPLANVIKDLNDSFKGITWESKTGKSPKEGFLIELGLEKDLTDYMKQGLPGFKKLPGNKVKSARGIIELGLDDNSVHTATIAIGRMNLKTLAALCKRRSWRLEDPDAENNSDVDLDDPDGWFISIMRDATPACTGHGVPHLFHSHGLRGKWHVGCCSQEVDGYVRTGVYGFQPR